MLRNAIITITMFRQDWLSSLHGGFPTEDSVTRSEQEQQRNRTVRKQTKANGGHNTALGNTCE